VKTRLAGPRSGDLPPDAPSNAIMSGRRAIAGVLEQDRRLPSGKDERFRGYAVIGLPFASGHVLALRRFQASSIGPGYTSVWHRSPAGAWGMWIDVDPAQGCPRYFGKALDWVVRAPISLSWPASDRLVVRITGERGLDWQIELRATLSTRLLSACGGAIPDALWHRRAVRSAIAAIAGAVLRVGRLSLHGQAPNGQRFRASPKLIWLMTGGHAVLGGMDLGPARPLAQQASLGEFLIPQRGTFIAGEAHFEQGPWPTKSRLGGWGRAVVRTAARRRHRSRRGSALCPPRPLSRRGIEWLWPTQRRLATPPSVEVRRFATWTSHCLGQGPHAASGPYRRICRRPRIRVHSR
jgi:hypothetical protein